MVAGVVFLSVFAKAAGFPLMALFLFFALTGYCLVLSLKDPDRRNPFLSLGFLYLLGIATILLFKEYTAFSPYFLPVAAFSMLAALLYRDLELAFLFSVGLSVTAGLIFGVDLYLTSVLLTGSIVSALFVWRARRRSRIMNAGFFPGLGAGADRPHVLSRHIAGHSLEILFYSFCQRFYQRVSGGGLTCRFSSIFLKFRPISACLSWLISIILCLSAWFWRRRGRITTA